MFPTIRQMAALKVLGGCIMRSLSSLYSFAVPDRLCRISNGFSWQNQHHALHYTSAITAYFSLNISIATLRPNWSPLGYNTSRSRKNACFKRTTVKNLRLCCFYATFKRNNWKSQFLAYEIGFYRASAQLAIQSPVLATVGLMSVRRPSVTRWHWVKTTQARITESSPTDSQGL